MHKTLPLNFYVDKYSGIINIISALLKPSQKTPFIKLLEIKAKAKIINIKILIDMQVISIVGQWSYTGPSTLQSSVQEGKHQALGHFHFTGGQWAA